MLNRVLLIFAGVLLFITGYSTGNTKATLADVRTPTHGSVPKSYGRLVAAIADSIGTGLVFEDSEGTIRFVSMTGMKEGELVRYEQTPTRGGIPKAYGRLVTVVVNSAGTGLIFEDSEGVVRLLTIAGQNQGELTRN